MKWLGNNGTTLAMAIVLSLLTVGLLTEPGENDPAVTLSARFFPEVKAPVGSVEYWVEDKKYTDRIPVTVSGERAQLLVIDLICRPILDERRFPGDPEKRETKVEITAKDFDLTTDLAKRIKIAPFILKITYAPMMFMMLPVKATAADIQDTDPRFRIESVRVIPPDIRVRLPVDKAATLKALPIKPLRAAGQIDSFSTEGRLNTDLPDLKDVRAMESFLVKVELIEIPFQAELSGVPLFLSYSPLNGLKADLIDRLTLKVVLAGPKDIVEKIRPEQVHVYVKLDWTAETQAGSYPLAIKCELSDESVRKLVRVSLAPGENIMAAVQVTRG